MKKIHVDGINGFLETNNKYVLVVLGRNNKSLLKEHVVLYNEIEDIFYKKPTREKYGFLTLNLTTKSYVLNEKIKYTLLLDRIDQKSLDTNKKIYSFIKSIIDNKKVEIYEIVKDEENIDEQEKIEIEQENNTNEKIIIKEIEKIEEKIIKPVIKIEHIDPPTSVLEDTLIEKTTIVDEEQDKIEIDKDESIKEAVEEINEELSNDNEIKKIEVDVIDEEKVEDNIEEVEEDIEEEILDEKNVDNDEIKNNKSDFETIEKLEKKIKSLEKELNVLLYKEIIINDFIDEAKEKEKIEKQIIELNNIIEKLEKLKKELYKQEKTINENDIIKIENGNVIITSIGRLSLDNNIKKVEKYLDIYKDVFNRVDSIEKDTYKSSKNADIKRKELSITDEEYEQRINMFKNIKSNKEFINKYIKETKDDLKKVKTKIEKTIIPKVKYKYVRKSISKQTKMLAGITTLNALRPKHSKLSMMALSLFTGVSSISDILGWDLKKIEYNEVTIKEMLIGLDYLDTSKIRFMIDTSKDQINQLLKDCEIKFKDYPKFNDLKKDLLSIKSDIEKEDEELKEMEDKIVNYRLNSKVKVLKYQE